MNRVIATICLALAHLELCTSLPRFGWNVWNHDLLLSSQTSQNYFEQSVDHFNREDPRVYKQRYFVNDAYWTGDGPVFLMIGGEGPESLSSVLAGHHVELAQTHQALLLCLEHRFYGDSIPTEDLSTPNLQYLSSNQALADLAKFIGFVQNSFNLTERNRLITFGGSYPGALSAWARLKLPHLVYAAVASSAPVLAQEDFFGYNDVVHQSLGASVVGGSQKCVDSVRTAFDSIGDMIHGNAAITSQLERLFRSCSPITSHQDKAQFVSQLASFFQGLVQYNEQMPGATIRSVCEQMTNEDDTPLNRLAQVYSQSVEPQSQCIDYSYEGMIKELNKTSLDAAPASMRQWLYQTCTQYGYYQTCEARGNCIFSPLMDLESNLDICRDLYGIEPEEVSDFVRFSNLWYGGNKPDGERILFVNGDIDPWHYLSVLEDLPHDQTSILIHGTSHCKDMAPSLPSDSAPLKKARAAKAAKIAQWLSEGRQYSSLRVFDSRLMD